MIHRFSSRRHRLEDSFLTDRLRGARSYDRIAGFFSSSILEVAGEQLQSVSGCVRLVCNSVIDTRDLAIAKKAAQHAMRREWCEAEPEKLPDAARPRFHRLYAFLASGKLQVKVMPDEKFGLIHGKAGVITLADGRRTAFLGSVNESLTAWRLNYELLWDDDSEQAVNWVQEEFDSLWHSPFAVELSEAVVQDIKRIAERVVIADIADWKRQPEPAAQWVDENRIEYPSTGPESIRKCPRRIGIVSTGLIIAGSEIKDWLVNGRYECVILDEAHRARRRNLSPGREYDPPQPNNLLRFLWELSPRTHSLLLATATPVQIHPIEVWELLDALGKSSDAVLGGYGSQWRNPRHALGLLLGELAPPTDALEVWSWMRNPLPPAAEGPDFQTLRRALGLSDADAIAPGGSFERLRPPDRARVQRAFPRFIERSNPFIRHIVLRTREYLENSIDPESGEPFLKPVHVRLHGERNEDAIVLPPFLEDAYHHAEDFCRPTRSATPNIRSSAPSSSTRTAADRRAHPRR